MLDDAVEEKAGGEKARIGMVVCFPSTPSHCHGTDRWDAVQVIRGNSVVMLEALERIGGDRDRG